MKKKRIFRLAVSIALAVFLLTTVSLPVMAAGTHEVSTVFGLYDRINALEDGDTIKLAADISIPGNNFMGNFDGKNVTFDLNGHNLSIGGIWVGDTSRGVISIINTHAESGGAMTVNSYLNIFGGSSIAPVNGGVLNVNNGQVSVSGAGSSATVNNVSNISYGVLADDGGHVTVNGDITVNTIYTGIYGASADGNGSIVTVNGDITVNGSSCYGVRMDNAGSGSEVTVNGSIEANGSNSYGVSVESSADTTVTVTGSVSAANRGVSINGGSGNTVTVDGSVTATNGTGASIGFGSGHSITIGSDVTVSGTNSYGALITASSNGSIAVGGSISATGSGTYTSGAYISGGGTITVDENILADVYGAYIYGGGTVKVGGDVSATSSGAYIYGGGTVEVTGNLSVNAPSDTYTYSGTYISGGGTVTVDGNLSITSSSSVRGANIYNGGTVTVDGDVSATSSERSATGVEIYNGTVTVGGDVEATGASSSIRGVSASGSGWMVTAGNVSAAGGTDNTGVAASGSGTATVETIDAASYIKIYNYPEITFSPGGGTLNETTGYFEYVNGSTAIHVKGWALDVDHSPGGLAGIGGTAVTTGTYEAGAVISLIAADTVTGYDFDTWTSPAGGSFGDAESASTTFTMPAADTAVTAEFQTVPTYAVTDSSAMTGGSVAASPAPAEEGDTVTLTVTPNAGKLYKNGTLKYNDGEDHFLIVTGNTATFTMPAEDVTVSADFEDITMPTVTTTILPAGTVTVSYSQQLAHGSNASAAWSVTSGSLPGGLSLSAGGVISGTPASAGTYTFTVQAANAGGNDTQELTLVVVPEEPVITTASLPYATEGENYSFQLEATGKPDIYWYISSGSLPDGLYLDYWNGTIYGTPSVEIDADTDYTFELTAYNDYGSDKKDFTLTIHPAPEYVLTLQAGAGGSIATGETGTYEAGAAVSIGAEPGTGNVFSGWTSSNGGSFDDASSASTTFTMPANATTVTANFAAGYAVNIPSMTGGSITASPALAAEGITVTLTITPSPGKQLQVGSLKYSYVGTDYPLTVTGNTASFVMPAADVTVSAVFEAKPAIEAGSASEFSDALDNIEDGSVIKLTDSFTYMDPVEIDGINVTLDTNGYILNLTVDGLNTALTVEDGGNLNLAGSGELNINADYYGVCAYNDGGATVTSVQADGDYSYAVYAYDGEVEVTGDVMAEGEESCAVYAYDGTVTVIGDVTANGDDSYGVYAYDGGNVTIGGNVTANGDDSYGVYVEYGSTVTVGKAISAVSYIVIYDYSQWDEVSLNIGDGTLNSTTGYFEYSVNGNTVFVKAWNLSVEAGTGGSIDADASGKYETGAVIPISATASSGYSFEGWTSTNGGTFDDASSASTDFTMPAANVTVTAEFEAIPPVSHTVSVLANPAAGGEVTVMGGSTHAEGTSVTVEATANNGYTFSSWTDGGSLSVTGSVYSFTMGTEDIHLTANFQVDSQPVTTGTITGMVTDDVNPVSEANVSLTVSGSVYSTTTIDGGSYSIGNVPAGTGYTVTASKSGYNSGSVTNVNVTAGAITSGVNITLTAIPPTTYIVSTGTITGGTITASPTSAAAVETIYLTVEPDPGKQLKAGSLKYSYGGMDYILTVTGSTASFVMPAANVTVTAEFEAIPPASHTVSVSANPAAGGEVTVMGGSTHAEGTSVTVEATANNGYTFSSWTDGGSLSVTGSVYSFTMGTEDIHLTANFQVDSQSVTTGTITGTVTDGNNPVSEANVSLTVSGSVYSTTTIDGGSYSIGDVPAGTGYTVTASKWGYNNGSVSNVNVTANTTTSGVNIILTAIPPTTYTVTYYGNGNNGGSVPVDSNTYTQGASITVLGNTGNLVKSGYTFAGWNTATNGSGTSYAAGDILTMGIDNVRLYARWIENSSDNDDDDDDDSGSGSGSSGGTSGNSGANTQTSQSDTRKSETTSAGNTVTATTTAKATTDNSGKAAAAVTQSQLSDAVIQAVTEAAKQGEGTAARVEIKVEAPADASTVETGLPKAAVDQAAESKLEGLTVSTPVAAITFDEKALSTIAGEASGEVKITTSKVEASTLSPEVQQVVGDRPVFDFSVTSGDRIISQFGGNVEVSVPYTPKAGEDTSAIVIYLINAEGKPELVSNCAYDPATGMITFNTDHFSRYAVGYNKVTFKDVAANAWYGKAVSFVAARGITNGTGNGNYSPEAKMTRGQLLVMVMKAYGIAPDANQKDNFADSGSTYYTGYLAAAKRLGISGGVGGNMFAPEKEITRQEMFTLLYNALKAVSKLPQGNAGKSLSSFSDAGEIASWAKDAMTLMAQTGTVSGSGGKLSPANTTTRAEMAQVLYNLLSKR